MRRTTTKTAKDQKTSSRAIPREGMDHIHVSSVRFRAKQEDKDERHRTIHATPTGGDQLLSCLHKAAQWLLTTPLKIGWMVQSARGGRQAPPPTHVDRRHYSTKTTSTEDQRQTAVPTPWSFVSTPSPR
jgi:hypothetical protein